MNYCNSSDYLFIYWGVGGGGEIWQPGNNNKKDPLLLSPQHEEKKKLDVAIIGCSISPKYSTNPKLFYWDSVL
jgi:hypothetical protein